MRDATDEEAAAGIETVTPIEAQNCEGEGQLVDFGRDRSTHLLSEKDSGGSISLTAGAGEARRHHREEALGYAEALSIRGCARGRSGSGTDAADHAVGAWSAMVELR